MWVSKTDLGFKMRKNELVENISRRSRFTKSDVSDMLTIAYEEIEKALASGKSVRLGHLGQLNVVHRSARPGFNPITQTKIEIPAKKTVTFRAFKQIKEAVNHE